MPPPYSTTGLVGSINSLTFSKSMIKVSKLSQSCCSAVNASVVVKKNGYS